jgi:hypothetical protein
VSNPTTARLKHEVDRGRGGDKVDAIDAAAAPLGTDDEAAGTPPSPATITRAHKTEIEAALHSSERRDGDKAVRTYIGIFVAIVLLLLCAICFVRP